MSENTALVAHQSKRGRKRDELMLLEDRAEVARLIHQGVTMASDICVRINQGRPPERQVGVQSIRSDINWLKEQWKKASVIDWQAYLNQTLSELDNLKRVCWEDYLNSRTPKITTEATIPREEIPAALNGEETNTQITKVKEERREGNPAYLQMIEKIIARQCSLLGFDAPSKIAFTDSKGNDINPAENILATLSDMNKAAKVAEQSVEQET